MKKMARQDQANDEFSLTSFLYGGNADYLEQLQAAYEDDPQSVDPQWQDFFAALKDDAIDVRKNAKGASWSKPSWPLQANGELVSALDGNWGLVEKVIEKKVRDKASGQRRCGLRRRHPSGDAQFGARHHDDPRLPHARPPARQSRSARHRQAARGL